MNMVQRHVYRHVYTHMCTGMCRRMCTHTCVQACVHTCTYTHLWSCRVEQSPAPVGSCIHKLRHMYTHISTHISYPCMYTCILACLPCPATMCSWVRHVPHMPVPVAWGYAISMHMSVYMSTHIFALPSSAMCSWFQVLPSAIVVRLAIPVIWYLPADICRQMRGHACNHMSGHVSAMSVIR